MFQTLLYQHCRLRLLVSEKRCQFLLVADIVRKDLAHPFQINSTHELNLVYLGAALSQNSKTPKNRSKY
ncbi:hypothetical protein C5167_004233 [Papaver somniferum]|nr:hypothetical protein C5167_004233 [Papaver somniferum]